MSIVPRESNQSWRVRRVSWTDCTPMLIIQPASLLHSVITFVFVKAFPFEDMKCDLLAVSFRLVSPKWALTRLNQWQEHQNSWEMWKPMASIPGRSPSFSQSKPAIALHLNSIQLHVHLGSNGGGFVAGASFGFARRVIWIVLAPFAEFVHGVASGFFSSRLIIT